MGCCFSISTPNTKQDQNQNGLKTHQPHLGSPSSKSNLTHEVNHRTPPSPPPPPVEEESVKEVLSETPISKPQVSILTAETKTQLLKIQYAKCPIFEKAEEQVPEEVSQFTETCSISESFSTTTTTTVTTAAATVTGNEEREDEATSKQSIREGTRNRNRNRSQSKRSRDGNRIGGRERRPKSPARTTPECPPEKRIPVSSRPVRLRESDQVRRDPGEGSGRRSRSPSAAGRVGAGNGRSQVKPPPGTVGRRLPPRVKGVVKENCVSERRVGEENDVVPHEESLENPHVSLECFIFL